MTCILDRRAFLSRIAGTAAAAALPHLPCLNARAQGSRKADHYASGTKAAATTTSREATEAALWALREGGNAADAYMTAALTQTVVEPGLTSIGGGFGVEYFDAATGETRGASGAFGPAKNEPYDFDRFSPVTQTGRAMPVPGYIAGLHAAHEELGKLPWKKLFEPAIAHAAGGALILPAIIEAAKRRGSQHPEGKALWQKEGRFLKPREKLVQADLAAVLETVASDGPDAFYEGKFAEHYVKRARADGGRITLGDMAGWRKLMRIKEGKPEGDYRGYQVVSAGLITYALHLNEALDLRSTGPAGENPETVFRQIRIMEEVFLATKKYSEKTHEKYVSPEYAHKRAHFVRTSPMRKVSLDALFNTCFIVVRDDKGNCAWGTHSINSPTAFGAGILVDGVYAAYVISRNHAHGSGGIAPGISTSFALYKDGKPRIIAGSPGFGFVHGPYQYGTGIVEWNLHPTEAMNLPRFGLPGQDGKAVFESHYNDAVFEMLDRKEVAHRKSRPTPSTGLVGALVVDDDEKLHAVQDGRRAGFARAV
jgi:gamma-glutamyltranspeptidase/glutathione hydrolase